MHGHTRKAIFLATAAVGGALFVSSVGAATITLQQGYQPTSSYAMGAASIRNDGTNATTPFGSDTTVLVGVKPGTGGGLLRTVMSWDISAIPSNATITNATMTLYENSSNDTTSGSTNVTLELRKLSTAFTESSVTWQSPWTTAGGDFDASPAGLLGSVNLNPNEDPTTFVYGSAANSAAFSGSALTAATQSALSSGTLSVILKAASATETGATREIFFFTSDDSTNGIPNTSDSARPFLSITYTAVPEPASVALMGFAGLFPLLGRRQRETVR